ncbi:hypothetical protein Tco_1108182 [Tanacetum coccineum]
MYIGWGVTEWYQEPKIIKVNVIPPNHVDDVPVVEPNQHDDVPVVPEPVLVDEGQDRKKERKEAEFEEEEDPQEEEDDMEVDIKEDENGPELTYPYEGVDPLNPLPPASESEPEDAIEVERTPIELEDDGFLSRRLFGCEVRDGAGIGQRRERKKKWKSRKWNEYYGKLIFDLGNEVHSSVEQGTAVMEKLVEKLGNAEDKESVDAAIAAKRARHVNARNEARGSGLVRGQDATPAIRECTFAGFMKCNPTTFHGTEGAVELLRWFKKTESVFGISEIVEGKKVKFATAMLH